MKFSPPPIACFFSIPLALSLLTGGDALRAQDVYERSQIVPEVPVYDSFNDEPDYNLRLGPFDVAFAVGLTGEWNDNVNLAPDDEKLDDFILRPFLQTDAVWRLSELNTLRLSLGLSYNYYLNNSEFSSDSVIITPTSAVAFSFFVGDFRITLSNAFSYQEDPLGLPTVSNSATYRRFENQAGIQLDYNLNEQVILTAGYTHYNLWVLDDEFKSLESAVDTVYFRPSIEVSPGVNVGLNTSASFTQFDDEARGDSQNYLVGPFLDYMLTEHTQIYLEVGWQHSEFDGSLAANDNDSLDSCYMRGEISNELNEAFSHRLALSYFAQPDFESNYIDLLRVDYGFDWKLTPYFSLRPVFFYERFESSAQGGEDGNRYGFQIGFGYRITPSVSLAANYRLLLKDSNLPKRDYTQNAVTLTLSYEF